MSLAVTILMKEIFKTNEEFTTYLQNDVGVSGDFLVFISPYVYEYYVNANVRYETVEAFKRQFKITFKNIFKKYELRHKILEETYKLTPKDLDLVNKQVSIVANSDNGLVQDPLEGVLEYVNSQVTNKQTANKLDAYITAVSKLSDDVIDDVVAELSKHFIKVLEPHGFYYCSEEE